MSDLHKQKDQYLSEIDCFNHLIDLYKNEIDFVAACKRLKIVAMERLVDVNNKILEQEYSINFN